LLINGIEKNPMFSVKSPADVLGPNYNYWEAISIDGAPDADAVLLVKKEME
jgi:hypothetical protein